MGLYDIHFLTGQKYWYQTAFCAYSLTKAAPDVAFRLHIFDDGSFDQALTAQVKKQFPEAVIHQKAEIEARLAQYLPAEDALRHVIFALHDVTTPFYEWFSKKRRSLVMAICNSSILFGQFIFPYFFYQHLFVI